MLLPKVSFVRPLKFSALLLALAVSTGHVFAGEEEPAKSSKEVVMEKPATEPRFYVDAFAGGEFDIHATKFISNGGAEFGSGLFLQGANGPSPQAVFGLFPAKINSRDFQSTHDVGVINGRVEVGYKLLPWLSIYSGFTYSHSNGQNDRRVGVVTDTFGFAGPTGARYDLYADVGDYQSYSYIGGFKIGLPRTILDIIHAPKAIKPYFNLSGGGKYLDAQEISFYNGGSAGVPDRALVNTSRYGLYGSGFVATVEGSFGYDVQLTRNFSVVLENGYGFDTKPSKGNIPRSSIQGVDNSGDRLYSTVSLGAKLSF